MRTSPLAAVPLALPIEARMHHEHSPGTHVFTLQRGDFCEQHITLTPRPGDNIGDLLLRLREVLCEHRASFVRATVFGARDAWVLARHALRLFFGGANWPLLWVHDDARDGQSIAGLQVLAVSGTEVEPVRLDDQVFGNVYEDAEARHCVISGLGPAQLSAAKPLQCAQAYARLEQALARAGMSISDVYRTHYYLDDILHWYEEFNRVRAAQFKKHGMLQRLLPASTGLGAANPFGAGITIGAWALQPLRNTTRVSAVASPLQCPAPTYGSFFSRAVEIETLTHRRLLVSGTASIGPGGATAHGGHIERQIENTFRIVQSLLAERVMSFENVTRATASFRHAGDIRRFQSWAGGQGLASVPFVCLRADACRPELLFQLEVDALAVNYEHADGRTTPREIHSEENLSSRDRFT